MSRTYTIFFFEDRESIADHVIECFRGPPKRPGDPEFEVLHYKRAADAISSISSSNSMRAPHLALLDRVQEDYTDAGMDICKLIGETWPRVPIIFLSDYSTLQQRTIGMEAGAINYLPKTVLKEENHREFLRTLAARTIEALEPPPPEGRYQTGNLVVNRDDWEASWRGEILGLSQTDLLILDELAKPENRTKLRTYLELNSAGKRKNTHRVHCEYNVRKRIQFIRSAFSRIDPEFPAAWKEKRHGIVTVSGRGYYWKPD